MKFLFSFFLLAVGTLFIAKTDGVIGMTGRIGWAERHLGGAGTYTFYKLLGLVCIIIAVMLVTGLFEAIFGGVLSTLFGGIRPAEQ